MTTPTVTEIIKPRVRIEADPFIQGLAGHLALQEQVAKPEHQDLGAKALSSALSN